MKCSTCGKPIGKQPSMEIFTVDSGIWRYFCLVCIVMGYMNLKKIPIPNQGEIDLMVKFEDFIKKHSKKKLLRKGAEN